MAMTLADIRAKYPQYSGVDDQKLADAIYNKYYSTADRREFDARVGLKPYDDLGTGLIKGAQNIIPATEQSLAGLSRELGEFVTDAANREGPAIPNAGPMNLILDAPANLARAAIGALPEDTRKDIAYQGAVQSLRGQLHAQAAEKNMQEVDAPVLSPAAIGSTVVTSGAQMVPAIAASVLMRNPTPALAIAYGSASGQAYSDARRDNIDWEKGFFDEASKAGLTTEQARQYAGFYGAAEAIPEMLPLGVLLKEGGSLIPRVLKGAATEGISEGITQAIQSALDKGYVDPDMTWEEAWPRIVQAMAAGTIMGGGFGVVAQGAHAATKPAPEEPPPPATPPTQPPEDTPIEDRLALPAPQTMLALPSPEQFAPAEVPRRQPPAPTRVENEPAAVQPDEREYQARIALQKTRQTETQALLDTARETITPLGTFTHDDIGEEAAGKVRQRRVQLGRPVEAPITVDELAAAKVPQKIIDKVIAARRPLTSELPLSPLDIKRTAEAKNIIVDDGNFAELAYRTTGQRNVARMTQAQLNALNSTLEAMPAHESPVTVPVADAPVFTEEQYNKALDAVRKDGRYTFGAIKTATGLKGNADAAAVRDAMVRRGQLVQRGKNDFRLYDVIGKERQTTPADLPPGAFSEFVTRRIPVEKVRIRQDGQSVATFGSATEARGRVRDIRAAEEQAGGKASAIAIEPAGDTAWGVIENRYDEAGNLLGQAVVSTHKDETAAQQEAGRMSTPDTGARYTQTPVETPAKPAPAPVRQIAPAALEGRLPEVLKRLNQQAKDRRLPLLGVRVQVKSRINIEGEDVEGVYWRKLMQLTAQNLTPEMSTDEVVEKLAQVMDHETIHALRAAGVLGPETEGWKAIVRYARRAKRPGESSTFLEWAKRNYTGLPGYEKSDSIEEEAIAEAFRAWAANKRNVVGQPATVFRQLVEWFRRLLNAIPEDAFSAIETGRLVELALRPPGSGQPRARATSAMEDAAKGIAEAEVARNENALRVRSREYLRARDQAREDRYGRSGPKTVLGTTPSRAYEAGPIADRVKVSAIVDKFKADNGVTAQPLRTYLPIDPEYLKRIADAQQTAEHAPANDAVAKSYRALIDETKAMWRALGDIEVTPWTGDGQPYASAADMLADLTAGSLKLRLSADMFGPGAKNPGHPFNAASGYKATDGRDLTINDLFRVVHDVYGHGQNGFRDDARGAYNAYHEHARLVSQQARQALATETLAQRAWQDFGEHLRRKDGSVPRETDVDYLPPVKREFAEQKAFLLDPALLEADPGWALAAKADGAEDLPPRLMVGWHGTPHKVDKFSSSKIGTGEGAQAYGWGLYFAGRKEVAEYYRDTLGGFGFLADGASSPITPRVLESLGLKEPVIRRVTTLLEAHDGDVDGVLDGLLRSRSLETYAATKWNAYDDAIQVFRTFAGQKLKKVPGGKLYKVDLPEDSELLDWDRPLSEQPPKVKEALAKLGIVPRTESKWSPYEGADEGYAVEQDQYGSEVTVRPDGKVNAFGADATGRTSRLGTFDTLADAKARVDQFNRDQEPTGEQAYDELARRELGTLHAPISRSVRADAAASAALRDAGIPGHRYIGHESQKTNYVIYDDSRITIIDYGPKFSRFADDLPGGRLYGDANRSAGGLLSKPDTPTPAFSADRPGNRFFGGELAEEQLRMARDGERGATMLYLTPGDVVALSGQEASEDQAVLDAAIPEGYKFSGMPSLVIDGYDGIVRVDAADRAAVALALSGQPDAIPVVLYPKDGKSLGLVTALEGNGVRVPWPHVGRAENFPDLRGPRYSVGSPKFKRWFGESKVVNPDGSPKVVYHGTRQDFNAFEPNIRKTEQLGFGIHFAEDEGFAARYADDDTVARKGKSPRVIPAFLSIQNPLKADRLVREGEPDFELARQIAGSKLFTTKDENGVPSVWLQNAIDAGSPARAQKAIQDAGYDGVEYESRIGSFVPGGRGANISGRSRSYIAFEPTQIKSAVNNNGQYDAANPDIRYSLNAPFGTRLPPTPPDPMYNIVQQRTDNALGEWLKRLGRSRKHSKLLPWGSIFDARIRLQDKMLSWKEIAEYAKEHGGSVTDINDVYMLEQLYHGKVFTEIEDRKNDLQTPLLNALQVAHDGPNKIQPKDLEDYLYARHAPERNAYLRTRGSPLDDPSGMSDAEARSILDQFALAGKLPELEALAALADRITADTTKTRVDAGLISEKSAASSPYEHYVPLRGFEEEDLDPDSLTDNQTRARSGRGFSVGGREDRGVTGRKRKAGDILGHIFLQNTEAVIRAEKNEVALAAIRFIQDNPGIGVGEVLRTAPTRLVTNANGMIREAGDPSYRQQPDILTAKWKGKEIVARLNDPYLARAIKSDYVTTSNDIVASLERIMGKWNRYLATVNTSINPEFLISNLARDMQTAGLLAAQYDIKGLGGKIIGNAPKAMGGIREVLREGTTEGEWAKLFRELQEAGGTTEFMGIHDLEVQVDRIRKSVTQSGMQMTQRKAGEYLRNVFKFVEDYNKIAENAFRLSAYKAACDAGVSVPKAAYLAKNLTINFNKGGEYKGLMNAAYLFYNASVQGSMVIASGLKNKRVQKLVGAVIVAGILQDIINRMVSGDDDDNGVPDYDDIPDYVLEHNFVLMDPLGILKNFGIDRGYFALPMPYGFNAFYGLGRNMGASTAQTGAMEWLGVEKSPVYSPGKAVLNTVRGFVDAFNPLGGVQSIWNFITPTIADPLVDLATNTDYAGQKIVPDRFDQPGGVPVPDSQKYWSNTGNIPKDTAYWLNTITGGNEVRKGWADVSPEVLQYGLDYVTGAFGKFIQRTAQFATVTTPDMLRGDFADVEVGQIPFLRRVIGSVDKRANATRYYDTAKEVFTVKDEIKAFLDAGQPERAKAIVQRSPVETRLIPLFDQASKSIADMNKQLRAIRTNPDLDADKRKELTDKIKDAMDRLMAQVNKVYFAQKSPKT